jgi:uncharacterized cupin superfamily protein
MNQQTTAQIKITCRDLAAEAAFLHELGFRTDQVFPADNPRFMLLTGWGLVLQLERGLPVNDLTLLLPAEAPQTDDYCVSPSGVSIGRISQPDKPSQAMPELTFSLLKLESDASWVTGRAGMRYRDLLPGRLNGLMIASNIEITNAGPVADQVHYHEVGFQLIVCVAGWVDVVYEDQGAPIRLQAGDCVTQPPGIRHQVLNSSAGLQVVEIGLPAEHLTLMDHDMTLPNEDHFRDRLFQGQRFSHHTQAQADWQNWQGEAWQRAASEVATDSGGLFAVHFYRTTDEPAGPMACVHQNPLRWYYLIDGSCALEQPDGSISQLQAGDSFLLPADETVVFSQPNTDFHCLELVMIKSPDEFL